MSGYEFSLRQEVLLEKGASVLGDLFRLKRETEQEQDQRRLLSVMYGLVWSAKQDILTAKTELAQIEGQFDLANRFLARIESEPHAG